MLTTDEIRLFIDEDNASQLKKQARVGVDYYNGKHDILDYRMFYYNAEGELTEDKTRSNVKIPHPFFTELVDQSVQFILSGSDIFRSDIPELQAMLDEQFNMNETFMAELAETLTGQQAKGFDYMYCYLDNEGKLAFQNADALGVVEVEGRFTADGKDQYIWKYLDRIDKEGHRVWKILVIDDMFTYYYKQTDDGEIVPDTNISLNPRPHELYTDASGKLYTKNFGFTPFFRLDNNKKRISHLATVKALIDDYDIMASSLTNNLIDFDTPLHVVKGFQGDNLDELQTNLKTKKVIGVDSEGDVEVRTVDIPYNARVAKLELDEKSIYRFGMGLNMTGLKDTSATTNIAIKAMYALLELRCNKCITQLKMFLRKILKVVIDRINAEGDETAYALTDVYFDFTPVIMSNANEEADISLKEAQEQQTKVNTLMAVADSLDNDTFQKTLCEILELDYQAIKDQLPNKDDAIASYRTALDNLGE